jgi:hypothetical protein
VRRPRRRRYRRPEIYPEAPDEVCDEGLEEVPRVHHRHAIRRTADTPRVHHRGEVHRRSLGYRQDRIGLSIEVCEP